METYFHPSTAERVPPTKSLIWWQVVDTCCNEFLCLFFLLLDDFSYIMRNIKKISNIFPKITIDFAPVANLQPIFLFTVRVE